MVIDKTSQRGTERWAMTGRRWHGGRGRVTTRLLIGGIPLQASGARTALTQAGGGGCWSTKKDEGSREGEKEEGAWDKVGVGAGVWLGKCKCMNSSETPWNACTVIQKSEQLRNALECSHCDPDVWVVFITQRVFSHLPDCHIEQTR